MYKLNFFFNKSRFVFVYEKNFKPAMPKLAFQ